MSDVAATNAWVRKPQSPSGRTRCDADDYERMYTRSIEHSEDFWAEQGARLDWFDKPTKIAGWSYDPVDIRWFEDGIINICHNAVDRHVAAGRGEGDRNCRRALQRPDHDARGPACGSLEDRE